MEDAENRYTTIFDDSAIGATNWNEPTSAVVTGQPERSILTAVFEIEGQPLVAHNGAATITAIHRPSESQN